MDIDRNEKERNRIRLDVSGICTNTKIEGDGENILYEYRAITKNLYEVMLETGMLPKMAERLIHGTASHGIKMAKEDK